MTGWHWLASLTYPPTNHSHPVSQPARCWNDNRVSYLATNECMHVDTFCSSSSHLVFCLHLESSPYVCTSLLSSLDIHIWIPWRLLCRSLLSSPRPKQHTPHSHLFLWTSPLFSWNTNNKEFLGNWIVIKRYTETKNKHVVYVHILSMIFSMNVPYKDR